MPVTNYIYNPLTEAYLMEQDGDGNTTVVYTQEPVKYGDVIAQHRIDPATGVGESFYYHTDALGSTRELTDASGTVVNTYNYDAFGNTIASTGTVENPFRFTGNVGYYWDEELSTYHIRARNYQPTTGRWTSQDPIGFPGGDTNLFVYVGNSPIIFIDPSGNAKTVRGDCVLQGKLGRGICKFVCSCPPGASIPLNTILTHHRPCNHPPAIHCIQFTAFDICFLIAAGLLSQLDSPAPGPADAAALAALTLRFGRPIALLLLGLTPAIEE